MPTINLYNGRHRYERTINSNLSYLTLNAIFELFTYAYLEFVLAEVRVLGDTEFGIAARLCGELGSNEVVTLKEEREKVVQKKGDLIELPGKGKQHGHFQRLNPTKVWHDTSKQTWHGKRDCNAIRIGSGRR